MEEETKTNQLTYCFPYTRNLYLKVHVPLCGCVSVMKLGKGSPMRGEDAP